MTKEAADAAEKLAGWRDTARNFIAAGALAGGGAHMADLSRAHHVAEDRFWQGVLTDQHTRHVNDSLRNRARQEYANKLHDLSPRVQRETEHEKFFQELRDTLPPEYDDLARFSQGPDRTPIPRRNVSPETRAANAHLLQLENAHLPIPMLSMGTPYPRR